jgi:hypothetical protein
VFTSNFIMKDVKLIECTSPPALCLSGVKLCQDRSEFLKGKEIAIQIKQFICERERHPGLQSVTMIVYPPISGS